MFYFCNKFVQNNLFHLFVAASAIIVFGYVCSEKLHNTTDLCANINENRIHNRYRRQIFRGQDNYYYRSYALNRLRFNRYEKYMRPRIRAFFERAPNMTHDTKFPTHINSINTYENFSDQRKRYGTKGGTKGGANRQPSSSSFNNTQWNMMLPTMVYQTEMPINRNLYDRKTYEPRVQPKAVYNPITRNYQPQPFSSFSSRTSSSGTSSSSRSSSSGASSASRASSSSASSQSLGVNPAQPRESFIPDPPPVPRIRDSTYPGIPGYIRSDFPGYNQVPNTGFSCNYQPYYGYYADTAAGCQVFHICLTDGRKFSFLCPNGTLFHQKVQTCDWWYYVDCPSSARYYYLNARIGVLPPQPATLQRF